MTELGDSNEHAGLNGEIRVGMPEGVGNKFEETEVALKGVEPSENSDGLHSALEDDGSPKSSPKAINEVIEVELFCLADRGVSDGVGNDIVECSSCRSMSDVEVEKMFDELAMKCFDSDSELNVPLKHFKGTKKKKPIVVLKRTTHSTKIF